ncbi:hypothetical protein CN918_32395 [Priestia megaterium]|nr:hypothetical protein CN918_32395 [Priestia megaterium]
MNISLYPVVCYILCKHRKEKQSYIVTPLDIQNMVRSSEDSAVEFFYQLIFDGILVPVPKGFLLSPAKSIKLPPDMKFIARQYLREYMISRREVVRKQRRQKNIIILTRKKIYM